MSGTRGENSGQGGSQRWRRASCHLSVRYAPIPDTQPGSGAAEKQTFVLPVWRRLLTTPCGHQSLSFERTERHNRPCSRGQGSGSHETYDANLLL